MSRVVDCSNATPGAVRSETRHGMIVDWEVPIVMRDGTVLLADVYRPVSAGRYPVLLSYGAYGKWLHFEDGYETAWRKMVANHPDVMIGSSGLYQNWEVVDPEKWVPHDYVVVRVDSRGAGRSPGPLDPRNAQETADYAECIEWAGQQIWSNGKVGLNGISYYAINQWQVAALKPKYLAAICAWEGMTDHYRDYIYHGGIYCTFAQNWYEMQLRTVQHGLGTRGRKSRINGDWVSGPETLTEEELGSLRVNMAQDLIDHPLDDEYHRERSADVTKIEVPILSCANWGGQGLHPRGNFDGFTRAASNEKWLEVHGLEHWTLFYADYGLDLQRRFYDHFLKGKQNGWDKQPRVQLQVRHPGERFETRFESDWPLPSTQWTKFHLHPSSHSLSLKPADEPKAIEFDALGDGLSFVTSPLLEEMEITGPLAARLQVSSSTKDADIFLVVRVLAPDFREVTFAGALDPRTPVAQGWLRASHRKLDPERSLPYQPYHTHDEVQELVPGTVYGLDVEIWPTSIVVPQGWRIALSVRGRDYVHPGGSVARLSNMKNNFTGCGPFVHDDPRDRPASVFGGRTSLHFGPSAENYLLLPVIPKRA
ncbi:CocE/NonD family hydrolase [Bradyrhizobium sp. 187]|uniref:CocE/NonD family hydrolase n=1 Tax=Bradyrhizobium sp. 187 TaxID=2782655 RepID=UPI001FFEAAC9|nr:CocE/NonD family hydrolase [Bradyrhizobium sp. 187]